MTSDEEIIRVAGDITKRTGYVTVRDIYAALPDVPSLHRSGKRDPSLDTYTVRGRRKMDKNF